jgi:hypothetical protein
MDVVKWVPQICLWLRGIITLLLLLDCKRARCISTKGDTTSGECLLAFMWQQVWGCLSGFYAETQKRRSELLPSVSTYKSQMSLKIQYNFLIL